MRLLSFILLLLVLGYSCTQDSADEDTMQSESVFVLLESEQTGIEFSNNLSESDQLNIIEYLYYYNGGGVAIGDLNGDGLEDIYFAANQAADQLYFNKGELQFEVVSRQAGIAQTPTWSTGVTIADFNNDGHNDIYVCKVALIGDGTAANELYINNGDGTFSEKAAEYGLDFQGFSTQAAVLDYDQDGDLDIYLLNHNVHSVRSYGNATKRSEIDDRAGDRLYENKVNSGQGFVNVSQQAGIYSSPLGYGLAVACADVNNDGLTDIYVGNDFHENDYLYINNGDKTFTESIASSVAHTSQFSMGVDVADINQDGYEDIFTTDMLPYDAEVLLMSGGEDSDQVKRIKQELGFEKQYARNHLQIGRGDGTWSDLGYYTETFATDWSWSVLMQDFTNDAAIDIFVTNGIVRRPNDLDYINFLNEYDDYKQGQGADRTQSLMAQMPTQPLHNILFQQQDDLRFSNMADGEVGPKSFSTGAAYADLDKDGDLDIVTNNINSKAQVLENKSEGNFIGIVLQDNNKSVHGTKIQVFTDGNTYRRQLHTTKGFMSSSSHHLHIGLGDAVVLDSLSVTWPDGSRQSVESPAANTYHTISKNRTRQPMTNESRTSMEVIAELPYRHIDNRYFDEQQEKLVPERLAYEGPAMLHEDVNGDGYPDVFLGGGRDQAATLLLGSEDGTLRPSKQPAFEADAKYEDVDVATIDFDGDGDRDLYVVSGGNDAKELDKRLEDRIYLNNEGEYRRIPLSLPHTNGSTVSVADFDGDGYEDIFVGARSIPGSYGLVPYSFLLKNMAGQGVDIAYKVRMGMLTDSHWADLDADGDPELIICGDWMPIRVFDNESGELTELTIQYGLAESYGLWNSITTIDLNGDGKLDIVGGNAGLNHKWKASVEKPVTLHVGDFDGNGSAEPLILQDYFGRYVPFAAFDRLATQLPFIKKRYTTYEGFSKITAIDDVVDNAEESTVESKKLTELRSMIYLSDGDTYTAHPLPLAVQTVEIRQVSTTSAGSLEILGGTGSYVANLGLGGSPAVYAVSTDINNDVLSTKVTYTTPLPVRTVPRAMASLSNGTYMIAVNNGNHLQLSVVAQQ